MNYGQSPSCEISVSQTVAALRARGCIAFSEEDRTVRYLGIEINDAIEIAEKIDV
jgi:hypothetical protein